LLNASNSLHASKMKLPKLFNPSNYASRTCTLLKPSCLLQPLSHTKKCFYHKTTQTSILVHFSLCHTLGIILLRKPHRFLSLLILTFVRHIDTFFLQNHIDFFSHSLQPLSNTKKCSSHKTTQICLFIQFSLCPTLKLVFLTNPRHTKIRNLV
jgi:hypothetical protein